MVGNTSESQLKNQTSTPSRYHIHVQVALEWAMFDSQTAGAVHAGWDVLDLILYMVHTVHSHSQRALDESEEPVHLRMAGKGSGGKRGKGSLPICVCINRLRRAYFCDISESRSSDTNHLTLSPSASAPWTFLVDK